MALLAAYLVFIGGAGAGIYTADLRLLTILGAAALLGGWVVVALRAPSWRPKSVLWPAIAAGMASLAIATVFSRYPRVSAEYLAYAIVLVATYLLLVRLFASGFFRARLLTLVGTIFVLIAIAYIGTVVWRWTTWWSAVGRLTIPPLRPEFESLTFGNPSNVLMMVALLAVPTIAAVTWSSRRGSAWVTLALALVGVVALLSGSRAGWLALAIAAVPATVAVVVAVRAGLRPGGWARRISASTGSRLAVVSGLAAIAILAVALAPAVIRRATEGGESLRLSYVTVAMRLFGESPVTGTGLGSWVIQRISATQPGEVDYYIPHAHNIYAQTLAEQGLVGAVAGIVVAISLGWLIARAIRDGGSRRQWGLATLVGLTYFAAHEALDIMVNLPAVLLALAIPIAYLDATAGAAPVQHRLLLPQASSPIASLAGGALVAVALGGLLVQELPARDSDIGVALANQGNWQAAREPAIRAARADPDISSYQFTAGLAEAHAGNHSAAATNFRRVAETDDLPEAWLNLAAEEFASGRAADSIQSLHAALRLGYQRPAVAMAAGDLALRAGDVELAKAAFTSAVATNPSLLADPWWSQDPAREAIYQDVVNAAMLAAPAFRQWEVALMSGDGARAATLAPDDHSRDFVAAWSGDRAAASRLDTACVEEPLNIQLLLLCARASGRAGYTDRANELRYIANVQIGGAYSLGAETRVATGPQVGRTLEGDPAIFWGTYTYRRSTPWDLLVPGVVHLTLE
jgi:tetratricopeptide (TPR) repeat protein/O-antigen ligase